MRTVLAKTSLALALGVTAGAAWAQADSTNIPQPVIQQTAPTADTGASGSATGAGAEAQTDTSGAAESGAAVTTEQLPATEGAGGEAAASGAAEGSTATQEQTGAAESTEQPATEGEAQQATETEQPASENGDTAAQDESQPSSETTAAINITDEQRTEIREVVREVNVEPVTDIDFEISVGVAVPRTIELRPLPPRIIELVPVYEGYRFFVLADGRIVIVEPASYEIVLIIA